MATPASPSAALVRTARSEIERIDRAIATIEQRRAALLGQLAGLDAEAEGYARRRSLLEELVYVERAVPTSAIATPEARTPRRAIKGAELRRVAGRLLWATQRGGEIHYREWFERVIAEGYAIGGKDPVASFLTNIRDSPAVIRGSTQGHYRLDQGALDGVARQIEETQAELADVEQSIERAYASAAEQRTIESLREHRDSLRQALKRLQGKMRELKYVFDEKPADSGVNAGEVETLRAA
jgi:DNA repair exonuclease SbcCD ATPase subunit